MRQIKLTSNAPIGDSDEVNGDINSNNMPSQLNGERPLITGFQGENNVQNN